MSDCESCGGDGIERCNNPDHGFITAMSFHDIGRLGQTAQWAVDTLMPKIKNIIRGD